MATTTPDLLWLILEELKLCVCVALDLETDCGCPCYAYVQPGGPVAWDHCCEGMLYVKADRIYPYSIFPNPAGESIICNAPLAAEIAVGILRCAPKMKQNGDFPTVEEISDAAKIQYIDAYVALNAIICCLAVNRKFRQFSIRGTTPLGPNDCQGIEIRLVVELVEVSE